MEFDRKKEVIDICLDHFIVNGLMETSTRSLSSALKLQNAGLYYYFSSKDEVVLICAEEAALRLERALIVPAIADLDSLDKMMSNLQVRADEMAPTMRFLTSVCTNKRYLQSVRPVLNRVDERYEKYTKEIADRLVCEQSEIAPYIYMLITSVSNYMIFADEVFITPQMRFAECKFFELIERKKHLKGYLQYE